MKLSERPTEKPESEWEPSEPNRIKLPISRLHSFDLNSRTLKTFGIVCVFIVGTLFSLPVYTNVCTRSFYTCEMTAIDFILALILSLSLSCLSAISRSVDFVYIIFFYVYMYLYLFDVHAMHTHSINTKKSPENSAMQRTALEQYNRTPFSFVTAYIAYLSSSSFCLFGFVFVLPLLSFGFLESFHFEFRWKKAVWYAKLYYISVYALKLKRKAFTRPRA